MNSKTLFYSGLILLITPFLGIYMFMKSTIIILIGIFFIVYSYKIDKKTKSTNQEIVTKKIEDKPLIRKSIVRKTREDSLV